MADFAKLKGKRIGSARPAASTSINVARRCRRPASIPRKDVQWVTNVPQPDLMKMLGQKQVDATDLAYQFGYFAQNNKWGPIVAVDDDRSGRRDRLYAARKRLHPEHRDVLVRFAMAYLQGVKEFNAAAAAPDKHPDIVEILAKTHGLEEARVVRAIAPHWSYINEDGIPNVKSVMRKQDYWADYFNPSRRRCRKISYSTSVLHARPKLVSIARSRSRIERQVASRISRHMT